MPSSLSMSFHIYLMRLTGDLALRSPAGLHQTDRFLLKFLGKPSLLCHRVPHCSRGTLHFSEASPPLTVSQVASSPPPPPRPRLPPAPGCHSACARGRYTCASQRGTCSRVARE